MDKVNPNVKRRFRNFLLQPLVQTRLAFYTILLSLFVAIAMFWFLYVYLFPLYDMVLELTDLRDEVGLVQASYILGTGWWVAGCIVFYLLTNIGLTVFHTHKLVGPTYAFRRHIQALTNGDYNSRVILRKQDAFTEVAVDLNKLAETLQKKRGS